MGTAEALYIDQTSGQNRKRMAPVHSSIGYAQSISISRKSINELGP